MDHFALVENESKARVTFNLLEKMLQPCGPPPEKPDWQWLNNLFMLHWMDKGCISFIWFQGQGLFFFWVFKCWPELNVYFNISEWTFYLIVLLSLKNEKVKCESSRALNWAASMLNALINQGTLNPDLAFLFQFALIFSLSPGIAPFLIGVPWFYFNN